MKHLKTMGLAVVMALILVAFVGATSASATTICVGGAITAPCTDGHPGGTVVLTSTNSQLAVHGAASPIQCSNSRIHGTAPATSAPTVQVPVTLTYSGCTAFGPFFPATVNVGASCQDRITLDVRAGSPATVTLPTGCTIDVAIPSLSCTVTIHGPSSFNASVTNGNASARTHATVTNGLIPTITVHPGGGFGCPTAGAHTGTLSGTYAVTTPATAPGVTVIS